MESKNHIQYAGSLYKKNSESVYARQVNYKFRLINISYTNQLNCGNSEFLNLIYVPGTYNLKNEAILYTYYFKPLTDFKHFGANIEHRCKN